MITHFSISNEIFSRMDLSLITSFAIVNISLSPIFNSKINKIHQNRRRDNKNITTLSKLPPSFVKNIPSDNP